MLTILRSLVNGVSLDIKKSRPLKMSGRKTFHNKLYNDCTGRVKSNALEMTKPYKQGYQDALIFDWSKVPVVIIFEMIDGYKLWAVNTGNAYFAGLAQGAHDVVMKRPVVL